MSNIGLARVSSEMKTLEPSSKVAQQSRGCTLKSGKAYADLDNQLFTREESCTRKSNSKDSISVTNDSLPRTPRGSTCFTLSSPLQGFFHFAWFLSVLIFLGLGVIYWELGTAWRLCRWSRHTQGYHFFGRMWLISSASYALFALSSLPLCVLWICLPCAVAGRAREDPRSSEET